VTDLSLTERASAELSVDALIVGSVAGPEGVVLAAGHGLPRRAAARVVDGLHALRAKAAVDEVLTVTAVPNVAAPLVVVTGLARGTSRSTAFEPTVLRRAAGAAVRAAEGCSKLAIALPAGDASRVGAVAEGAALGAYTFQRISTSTGTKPTPVAVTVVCAGARSRALRSAVARARILAQATNYARDLVNTPPNKLYPQSFVDSVRHRAAKSPGQLVVTVLDETSLADGGFGGILGVGQASAYPPRLVTLSYAPAKAAASIALVGKGITFDSGGLNIKPTASMLTMKSDMAGAAAVAGAVLAVAELGLPVAVRGYLCLAENMPGGAAQRPGDVVTMRNGTTVEILDTDAEGRMVLADGICLASEQVPDAVVDIATLTGTQVVALGTRVAGIMANDDAFRDRVCAAAESAGEAAWPMPLPEDLRKGLDSPVADLAHKADRNGGMLTAGLFLREFVGQTPSGGLLPWAHIDMAGPSFNAKSPYGYTPKGGTGYGVSTLLTLVEGFAG
jgi:leucyl aminopeptidase